MKKFFLVFIAALALAAFANTIVACGDDGSSNNPSDPVNMSVSLMKGPPKPNTEVDLFVQNDVGEYVKQVGNAKTEDYYGTASFTIAAADLGVTRVAAGPAEFWDEISGLMLTGMRLETFVDTSTFATPPDPDAGAPDGGAEPGLPTINFGVCGHLTAQRVQNLMEAATPLTFADAKAQAESELVTALNAAGIIYTGTWIGCEAIHVIGSDNPDSQYGAALHCAFDKLANMEATDTVEIGPNLQGFLDDYAADLGDDGLVTVTTTNRLKSAVQAIEPMTMCINKLATYIAENTGTTPISPDANASTDMDGDGIPNASDPDIDGDGFPNGEDEAPYDASVGGGMFIDSLNGFGWQLVPPTATSIWSDAVNYCNSLSLGGNGDWRMPSLAELGTLVFGCDGSSCVEGLGPADGCYWMLPLQGECFAYWANDACETSNRSSLQFNIAYGACLIPADSYYIRCVRTL